MTNLATRAGQGGHLPRPKAVVRPACLMFLVLSWCGLGSATVPHSSPDSLSQLGAAPRPAPPTAKALAPGPATNATVNGQPAPACGDFTFAGTNFALTNGANTFTIIARNIYGQAATNVLNVNLPASVALQYDLNGNLTSDGTRWFAYDTENQLVSLWVTNAWRSDFVYDGLGRRRIERDYAWSSATGNWQLTNQTRLVYDGWLVVQERDSNNLPRATYTRGLDLSGTLQGAGGIGGLLALTQLSTNNPQHFYYHSDGAGNATGLIDSNENMAARYLYGPFGRLTAQWGALAGTNAMQFSSMPRHANSGLSLYPFRAYDPTIQQWLTRDPMGEGGGINLYGFVGNSPITYMDPLGLSWYKDLFNYVGDKELAVADAVKQFFLGSPGGVQLKDPGILRAGSGLIQGLKDEYGNDITKETVAEIGLLPLMAVVGGPEREGATIFGDAVKCKKLAKVADAAQGGVLQGANYAQRTFSSTFSSGGTFAGQTVEGVAAALRSGTLSPADVPIQYIVQDGNTLMLNTRSAQALEQAGVPRAQWNAVNMTGDAAAQARLAAQLQRNGLTSQGIPTVTPGH